MASHPTEKAPRAYSRLGLFVAIALCLVGLGALALGAMPADWRQQAVTYAGDAWQSAQTLGDRLVPLAIGTACLVVGLITLVLVVRRGRARRRQSTRPSDMLLSPRIGAQGYTTNTEIAPVSVYLDFENQTLAAGHVPEFVKLLRHTVVELTGGDRADFFLYCDASIYARAPAYQALQQYGFRVIDVPHTRFDEAVVLGGGEAKPDNLKNFVDFEMSLHAYQRALPPAPLQHIFLVTTDKDFIPLVRRLRALGHHVHVWAREVDYEFARLKSTLGVETVSFGNHLPSGSGSSETMPSATRKPVTLRKSSPQRSTGPTGPILKAIDATFKSLQITENSRRANPGSAKHWGASLRATLGGWANSEGRGNLLARLGYDDAGVQKVPNRVQFWLDELKAVGVLADGSGPLPIRGPTEPTEGATLLYGFLQRDIAEALASWEQSGRTGDLFEAVCGYVVSRESDSEPQPIRNLRHLLIKDEFGRYLRHAQYLCQCARSLGLTHIDPRAAAISEASGAAPAVAPAVAPLVVNVVTPPPPEGRA